MTNNAHVKFIIFIKVKFRLLTNYLGDIQ